MKIENININDIKPYENNPRKNGAAAEKVAESIRLFGFKNPSIYADDLTDEQIKAFR